MILPKETPSQTTQFSGKSNFGSISDVNSQLLIKCKLICILPPDTGQIDARTPGTLADESVYIKFAPELGIVRAAQTHVQMTQFHQHSRSPPGADGDHQHVRLTPIGTEI